MTPPRAAVHLCVLAGDLVDTGRVQPEQDPTTCKRAEVPSADPWSEEKAAHTRGCLPCERELPEKPTAVPWTCPSERPLELNLAAELALGQDPGGPPSSAWGFGLSTVSPLKRAESVHVGTSG